MTAAADQVSALSTAIVSQSVSHIQSGARVFTITAVLLSAWGIVCIHVLSGLTGGGFTDKWAKRLRGKCPPLRAKRYTTGCKMHHHSIGLRHHRAANSYKTGGPAARLRALRRYSVTVTASVSQVDRILAVAF